MRTTVAHDITISLPFHERFEVTHAKLASIPQFRVIKVDTVLAFAVGSDPIKKVSIKGHWITKSGMESTPRHFVRDVPLDILPREVRDMLKGRFVWTPEEEDD